MHICRYETTDHLETALLLCSTALVQGGAKVPEQVKTPRRGKKKLSFSQRLLSDTGR